MVHCLFDLIHHIPYGRDFPTKLFVSNLVSVFKIAILFLNYAIL